MGVQQIVLRMNRHRYEALAAALEGAGTNMERELYKTFDALYMEYLPPEARREVEAAIESEEAERKRLDAESRRFTAFRITENGAVSHIESERLHSFATAAIHCRRYLRGEYKDDGSAFKDILSGTVVDEATFERHVEQFGESQNVCAVFDVDLDKQIFSGLDKDRRWHAYPLKDVSTAAYYAFRTTTRSFIEKTKIFHSHLEGKEMESPALAAEQPQGIGQGMRM